MPFFMDTNKDYRTKIPAPKSISNNLVFIKIHYHFMIDKEFQFVLIANRFAVYKTKRI